jgi:3-oxoacyl-[acyl-carrier protein] reductase
MEEKKEVNTNKVVIVTGGSRGIGASIVQVLAQEGYSVVLNFKNSEEKAKKIKKDLNENGFNVEIFKADVSKREEVKKLIEFTLNKFGNIDILVNNAGIDQEKMFQDISDEDWNEIIKVDLYSVFCMTQEALPTFLHNKNGCIINISSIYGVSGGACAVAYSAAKAGIIGLTKSLAKELGPSNIRVNAIAPGCINTDMISCYTKEELEDVKKEIPLNKIGNPSDIAKCVKWLADDEYTTGQVISINGGWDI